MKIIHFLRALTALFLFGMIMALCFQITMRSSLQQIRKYDEANINHMKYGIFNVNAWRDKLTTIIISEIENFQIEDGQKNDLKKHVEGQLGTLIDKLDQQIKESNKNSTAGWLKQQLLEIFVDVKEIKASVPNYADTIVQQMTQEDSQKKLKEVVKTKVSKYLHKTFKPQDMTELNSIIQRSNKSNQKEAAEYLKEIVPTENADLLRLTWMFIAASILLFAISLLRTEKLPLIYFAMCTATLILLLYAGVTRPMIDMVARISDFSFMLVGHQVEFKNQVVYFQSKSVLDVFWILMENEDYQMKAVGILMILFSIVLPSLKIILSLFYYYDVDKCRSSKWIQFFVLKSGKWSMADVLIVAMMMAYIGFNGMVKTQFDIIRAALPKFDLISTNDTALQIGFYIFLCYVILSMLLALVLERQDKITSH